MNEEFMMDKPDYEERVDKRFPGLPRFLDSGRIGAYMFLDSLITTNSINEFELKYPNLVENLEFTDPNPFVTLGPSSRSYANLKTFFEEIAKVEWERETNMELLENFIDLNKVFVNVAPRFPGLTPFLQSGFLGIYLYLDNLIMNNDYGNLENEPVILEYLESKQPSRDIAMSQSNQTYQVLSDLLSIVAIEEWEIEAEELDDDDELLKYPPPTPEP